MTLAFAFVRLRSLIALTGALLALPAVPAAAQSEAAMKVFQDYAGDGQIDPCRHSSEDLRSAERSIPPDIEQYAPDYPAAVRAALEARARGDCGGRRPPTGSDAPAATGTGGAAPPSTPTPAPERPTSTTVVEAPPAPEATEGPTAVTAGGPADGAVERAATATASNSAPGPVLLLAILAALMLGTGLLALAARRFGWGEERLASPIHTWREAGWRAGGVWDDFRDWLRLGR